MRTSKFLVALATLVLIAGCSSEEPAAPDSSGPEFPPQPTAEGESEAEAEPETEAETEAETPGLAIGEQAPAFELQDQHGKPQSLSGILESGPAARVFYRSADWCPFCRKQLVQLRHEVERLSAAGVQIVGISYDSPDILKAFSDAEEIPFLLLSDEGSKTINAFGLHNKDGLPHPGTVLIDPSGVIRAKIFKEGYRVRHTVDELVEAAGELSQ
jgi:peroxiredoxin